MGGLGQRLLIPKAEQGPHSFLHCNNNLPQVNKLPGPFYEHAQLAVRPKSQRQTVRGALLGGGCFQQVPYHQW